MPYHNDGPDYSPDGKWIYINSDRSGKEAIWRFPAKAQGAPNQGAEMVLSDGLEDWFPHLSPDGKRMVYIGYPAGTPTHNSRELQVELKLTNVDGGQVDKNAHTIVTSIGGRVRSTSTPGRQTPSTSRMSTAWPCSRGRFIPIGDTPLKSFRMVCALCLPLATIAMLGAQDATPSQVPDWAMPGSPTHKQVPPPADFHRPTRTEVIPLGIFQGQSDVGGAVVPGSSSYDMATHQYTIRSAGYNIWYSRDEFRYVWKKMSGDVSLAGDATFPDPQGYSDRKAVLVIRQSLDDDSSEAVVGEHGTGMVHLAQRAEKGSQMTDAQYRFGGTLANVRAKRIGIEKRGNEVAIFISLTGEPMHQFGPPIQTHFQDPFYVGVGFCSHLPAKVDTAVFSDVILENKAGRIR